MSDAEMGGLPAVKIDLRLCSLATCNWSLKALFPLVGGGLYFSLCYKMQQEPVPFFLLHWSHNLFGITPTLLFYTLSKQLWHNADTVCNFRVKCSVFWLWEKDPLTTFVWSVASSFHGVEQDVVTHYCGAAAGPTLHCRSDPQWPCLNELSGPHGRPLKLLLLWREAKWSWTK